MSVPLNDRTVSGLHQPAKPSYNREGVNCGIVHLGTGGFHRAHQAVYTDDLLATGDKRWGITGASLRSSSVHDKLAPQDFLYTVHARGARTNSLRVIGSIKDVLVVPQKRQLAALAQLIANPATQVVTLTITEKGYCADHRGELDLTHPDVVHDLHNPHTPRSAAGVLVLGLTQRMINGAGPLTVLSCDNLAGNGGVTRNVVRAMAAQMNRETSRWLLGEVSFPASMVDRIVPQTSPEDIAAFEADTGYTDAGLIVCEAFSQWVIEDQFAGERPAWDHAGAQFVASITDFEQAKLRLLNATHSALAYLGLLAGYEYVHQAVADPLLAKFVRLLMDVEITPAVRCPTGLDLAAYKASILDRFSNPAVPYRTHQVASDGSQKLPQRIHPTIKEQLPCNTATPCLYLVIAGWLHCLHGSDDAANSIAINDPLAQPVLELSKQYPDATGLVRAISRETTQFGALGNSEVFLSGLTDALINIRRRGALATVGSLVAGHT